MTAVSERIPAYIRKGLILKRELAELRQHDSIARHAPRADGAGWALCAGCDQSCTGSYATQLGCTRCGIVGWVA